MLEGLKVRTNNIEDLKDIDSGLFKIIENVERRTKSNFFFNSIKRSLAENTEVGGWVHSQHVDWDKDGDSQAVDIARWSFDGSPEEIAKMFFEEGATGVGIYNTHIHVDNNPSRVANPYFKDNRTIFNSYDKFKNIISFNYFKTFYDKTLANDRKGKDDKLDIYDDYVNNDVIGSYEKAKNIDEGLLLSLGIAVATIIILSKKIFE